MPPIKKLPPKVQSALQTGITITDTSRCILELIQNSLDAGATSITVDINLKKFNIIVTDNGIGLTQSDFTDIGKRYMTSKCHSLHELRKQIKYYGFRGEALASIRESCRILTIISKAKWSTESLCKVFINGVDTEKIEQSEWINDSHGTIITVEDFLYNKPIRRNRINPVLEIEKIRKNLLPVALINYKVSFTLKNDVTNKVVFESQPNKSIDEALQKLCETKASKELVSVTTAMKNFKVSGYISKVTEISSKYQFVYVNKHFIKKNKIHTFVNKCLSKSFYFRGIFDKRLSKTKNFSNGKVSGCKNINTVFIINIECPLTEYDICFSPAKTIVEFKSWPTVLECIEKAIGCFFNEEQKENILNEDSGKHKHHNKLAEQVIGKLKKSAHKKIKEYTEKTYLAIQDNNNLHCLFKDPEYKKKFLVASKSLKIESENPFTSSMESKKILNQKKRKFTDHVITTSEMDETSYDQYHCDKKLKLNNRYNLHEKRSILPVVSEVFYKSKIHEIQADLKILKANKKSLIMSSDCTLYKNNSICFKNKKKECITEVNIKRKVDFKVDFLFNRSVEKKQHDNRHTSVFHTTEPFLKRSNENISTRDFKISDNRINKDNPNASKQNTDCPVTLSSTQLQVRNIKFHNQNIGSHLFQSTRQITHLSPVGFDIKNLHSDEEHTDKYSEQRISHQLRKRHNEKKEIFVSKVSNSCNTCSNNIKKAKLSYMENGYNCFNNMRKQKENTPNRNKIIINSHHGVNNSKSKLKYMIRNIYNQTKHFNPEDESPSVLYSYTSQTFSPLNKENYRNTYVKNVAGYDTEKELFFYKPQKHLLFEKSLQPDKKLIFKEVLHFPDFERINMLTPDLENAKSHDFQPYTVIMDKNKFSSRLRKINREPSELSCLYDKNSSQTDHICSICCASAAEGNVVFKHNSLFLTHMLRNTVIIVDLNSPIKDTVQQENKTINDNSKQISEKKAFDDCLVNAIPTEQNTTKSDENKCYTCQKEEYMLNDTKNTTQNDSTVHRLKDNDIFKQEEICCTSQITENTNIQNELHMSMVHESILSSDSKNKMGNARETRESIFTPLISQSAFSNSHLMDEENLLPSLENNEGNRYLILPSQTLSNSKTYNIRENKTKFKFSPKNVQHTQSHINFKKNNKIDVNEEGILMFSTMSNPCQLHQNNKVNCITSEPEETNKTYANKINETRMNVTEDNIIKSCNKENGDVYIQSRSNSQWLRQILPNGVNIYVHSKTGMSSYFTPVSLTNEYLMKRRHWFMPKGSSPLLNYLKKEPKEVRKLNDYEKDALQEAVFVKADTDELSSIKWKGCKPNITASEDILSKLICEAKIPDDVTKLMQKGKPVTFNKLIYNLQSFTKSYVFTCESFLTAKVVGQVDCKFIAITITDNRYGKLLVLLDQHAVDERIQFEKLITDYKGTNNRVITSKINPGISITLSKSELQLISHFKTHFEHSGLQIDVNQSEVTITSVPTCLYNWSMKEGSNQTNSVLKNLTLQLIKEELECLQETKGIGGTLPKVIHTVISYEACRGAVKFGDKLSVKPAENLIRQLAQCSLPFQCAHGRPVLAPINTTPNLKKLKLICIKKQELLNVII